MLKQISIKKAVEILENNGKASVPYFEGAVTIANDYGCNVGTIKREAFKKLVRELNLVKIGNYARGLVFKVLCE